MEGKGLEVGAVPPCSVRGRRAPWTTAAPSRRAGLPVLGQLWRRTWPMKSGTVGVSRCLGGCGSVWQQPGGPRTRNHFRHKGKLRPERRKRSPPRWLRLCRWTQIGADGFLGAVWRMEVRAKGFGASASVTLVLGFQLSPALWFCFSFSHHVLQWLP